MKIKIKTFGSLTEILDNEIYNDVPDTDSLIASVFEKHAALKGRTLLIAVNNVIIRDNRILNDNDIVTIMPPYSGG
ncbi:MoaD/ThiS family protein [Sphingobacterium sp.]|uniref:MoaD/ThiS family protein n=1 Tax=Sphingobacterium sp. TaxID=341027 RepID=UPI00289E04FA|nr:MoaD/ThiS family protein [Sphingobacterium sp.]